MSIANELYRLECEGEVYRFTPKSRKKTKRRAYLTKAAQKQFESPNSAVNILLGEGVVRAALTLWTLGERVNASKPGKTGGFLKELDPPPNDIWEIRITHPAPQARLIGTFLEPDTFLITGLHTRTFLGDKGSQAWQDVMEFCEKSWINLSDEPVFRADAVSDYVTEKCDDFPLKR